MTNHIDCAKLQSAKNYSIITGMTSSLAVGFGAYKIAKGILGDVLFGCMVAGILVIKAYIDIYPISTVINAQCLGIVSNDGNEND
jgi:hypothetical protein